MLLNLKKLQKANNYTISITYLKTLFHAEQKQEAQ